MQEELRVTLSCVADAHGHEKGWKYLGGQVRLLPHPLKAQVKIK